MNGKPKQQFAIVHREVFDSGVGASAVFVYAALALHANEQGECWPSIAAVATLVGSTDRHVRRNINQLCKAKLLTIESRHGRSNRFRLTPLSGADISVSPNNRGADTCVREGGHGCQPGGDTSVRAGGDTHVSQNKPIEQTIEQTNEQFREFHEMFLAKWNSLPGVSQGRRLKGKRLSALKARYREGDDWPWREAMAKFPLKCFAGGDWKPNTEWFLRPDTVNSILEGKYDWSKRNGNGRPGPGQLFDANATGVGDI